MSHVVAIDPGNELSALVVWNGERIDVMRYLPNEDIRRMLIAWRDSDSPKSPLAIEKIASFGMPVGAEVFETVYWSGRFAEAYGADHVHRVTRGEVKMHLCHSMRAKDGNIRQALIDRFGGKEKAIGKKAAQGVFYGISGDLWAALAVAVTYWDQNGGDAGHGWPGD